MASNHRNRKRRRWIILSIVIIVLAASVFGVATMLRPDHKIDPAKLAKVERGDIAKSVVATGRVEPLTQVEIKSKASGIVKKIDVDYGDRVKTGQLLLELDKEQLQASVNEARASLQAAQAAVESAEATNQRNVVDAEGPDLPFLKSTVARDRKLASDGLIAMSVLDNDDKNLQIALNHQLSAQRNVAVSRAEIARAKAQVAQAQANLDQAEENLRNSTILSPIDGMVLSRDVEVGDAVSSILVLGSEATKLFTLGDISEVYVRGKVDEADVGKIFVGQQARISVESFPNKKFYGKVTKISPMGVEKDNVTTFEVRVSIRNPGGELRANMSANAEIILEEKHDALLIPETALLFETARKPSVEIPAPEAETGWRKVPVKLGIQNGVKAEVLDGLKEGQPVVLQ
jgi:HlyD family secretion protein